MNQIDLGNRVAVVTGGARGIGYAIAERLLDSALNLAVAFIVEIFATRGTRHP